jgi:hypothetical protein
LLICKKSKLSIGYTFRWPRAKPLISGRVRPGLAASQAPAGWVTFGFDFVWRAPGFCDCPRIQSLIRSMFSQPCIGLGSYFHR